MTRWASWPTILFRIIFPNVRVAVLSGAFLTFAIVITVTTAAGGSGRLIFPVPGGFSAIGSISGQTLCGLLSDSKSVNAIAAGTSIYVSLYDGSTAGIWADGKIAFIGGKLELA